MADAFGLLLECAQKTLKSNKEGGDLVSRTLMAEATFYELATSILQSFVERVGNGYGMMTAKALFSTAGMRTPLWTLTGECQPELHVRGNTKASADGIVPGFNGELKTAGDRHGFEQAVFYAVMDTTRIFFPATEDSDVVQTLGNEVAGQAAAAAAAGATAPSR